ncbi:MAG TPA: ornithine carbamoyltransferase [Candidatus Brocadiia bacterium]|nr:ornithine carbamoyltransferase [Planctomycetota bacterium]MDO8092529.1 ornithine carbamoyltransferase [Candidatus Brocadiales bacterium]
MNCRHLISDTDLSREEVEGLFALTSQLKEAYTLGKSDISLSGKSLAMIFEKSSMRTRVSLEVAMTQLGGHAIYLTPQDINIGKRESIKDVARVLSRYVDCIAIRTFSHNNVAELARHASVPVINALSDYLHPCQALADLYTIKEKLGTLKGVKIAFVGDANNVARSLALLCATLGVSFNIASPKGYEFPAEFVDDMRQTVKQDASALQFLNPRDVVKNADVIYTDTWISMGQEGEAEVRRLHFKGYQVNKGLVALAKKGVLVMHCLPAHRGEEITDEVIDGPNSIVFDQAENRLHVEKAILKTLLLK